MAWRLGVDVGTNSVGWAALRLDDGVLPPRPDGLLGSGVRIFSDGRNPKDRQSLAVARREPRQHRRRRDRYLKRRDRFLDALTDCGLMPTEVAERKALEKLDPWELRVRGLDYELPPYHLGRALFHLQQRRGFKSNRKTDGGADDESGKIKSAAADVRAEMQKQAARTLGEYLAKPRVADRKAAHKKPVRARLSGSGAEAKYNFYPTRDMIAEEFDALWQAQQPFHPEILTDDAHRRLTDILFYQRELKPQPVGKCTLIPTEERAPRALPSVQRLRIYQELNHLEQGVPGSVARKLTLAERDILAGKALTTGKLTFDAMRKALKLPAEVRFNLESEKRKHLDGDKTAAVLAHKDRWGPAWRKLDLTVQEAIVERLLTDQDEAAVCAWLVSDHGLTQEAATAVGNALLPQGHGNLGRTAGGKVLQQLVAGEQDGVPLTYDQAVLASGLGSHSELGWDGEVFDQLPYYGKLLERSVAFGSGQPGDSDEKRYGKLANPTVHVALNQLRRVVNALIQRYGPPSEIVVEMARELPLSAKGKSELDKQQRENQAANDARRKILAEYKLQDSYENRLRLRLWEALNKENVLARQCPYTGEPISIERLFQPDVEVEHILPFSRTLDDGIANKTLSLRRANRDKGQKTPYEAFGHSPPGYDWAEISARVAALPASTSWRFYPDAMDRFDEEERGFLARQLNDTRYMARLAKDYLRRTGAVVWVTPGRLTADLRWALGLDSALSGHNVEVPADPRKNRNDHRHHAIDAVVIGLTDRGLLQKIATEAGRAEREFDKRYLANIGEPWPNFRAEVKASVDRLVVSHKPDHGVQGALHNDTAYGIVEPEDSKGRSTVVHRVPLSGMTKPADLDAIRDPLIRDHLKAETVGLTGKEFTAALVAAGEKMTPPVRKVRILETLTVIPITDKEGNPYKAYKGDGNYCYDIYAAGNGRWSGDVISRFAANRPDFDPNAKHAADGTPLIMRIRGGDMLAIEDEGQEGSRKIMRVVKFSKGKIALAAHMEAGALKARDKDKDDPFKYKTVSPSGLQKLRARIIHVDPAGRVFDPGPGFLRQADAFYDIGA